MKRFWALVMGVDEVFDGVEQCPDAGMAAAFDLPLG